MSRFRTRKIRGLCRPQHLPRLRQRTLEALEGLLHHVGRHPVADCRVGVPAVVAGLYEADHGEDRLLARGRRAAAVHLASEGREEGLCRRVAVAAAGDTARGPHVVFPGPRRQHPRGVLAVAVAVGDGPSALWPRLRAGSRAKTTMSAAMRPDTRPPGHHAGVEVDHGGQEQPALPRAQVGDVACELVGGHGAGEVAQPAPPVRGRTCGQPRTEARPRHPGSFATILTGYSAFSVRTGR